MITFEQFYLMRSKHLPMCLIENSTIYWQGGNNYTIEEPPAEMHGPHHIVGHIVDNPPPTNNQYKNPLRGIGNIAAAMGVEETDIVVTDRRTTQSKIYAFHLAKYKLETPGPRENNEQDLEFYNNAVNSTAALLSNYINGLGNDPYIVLHPYSRNRFNTDVLNQARVPLQNIAVVNKYTYAEAAANLWNNENQINNAVLGNDQKAALCKAALTYLRGLIQDAGNDGIIHAEIFEKHGNNRRLNTNDFVSRETLAYACAQIHNNLRAKFREFITETQNIARDVRDMYFRIPYDADDTAVGKQQKGYLLKYLRPIYFKPFGRVNMSKNVIVVDDNINSKATYDDVSTKIKNRAAQQNPPMRTKIQWIVGIVPLAHTINPPIQQAAQAAQQEQQPGVRTITFPGNEESLTEESGISSFAFRKISNNLNDIKQNILQAILGFENIRTTRGLNFKYKINLPSALTDRNLARILGVDVSYIDPRADVGFSKAIDKVGVRAVIDKINNDYNTDINVKFPQ